MASRNEEAICADKSDVVSFRSIFICLTIKSLTFKLQAKSCDSDVIVYSERFLWKGHPKFHYVGSIGFLFLG